MGMDHEKVTSGHISEGKNGYHSPPEAINCQQPLSLSQTSETYFLPMLECWQASSSSDLVQVTHSSCEVKSAGPKDSLS